MIEARAFLKRLEPARKLLKDLHADFKGEYAHKDIIFRSKNKTRKLSDEFLRLRVYSKNIWGDKNVIVVIKETEQEKIGKKSTIPLYKEFDTEKEAFDFVENNLKDKFEYDFEFSRTGWQYNLGHDQIDLEDIEGYYSIEIKSSTAKRIKRLVKIFDLKNIIKGPSVVSIKKLI